MLARGMLPQEGRCLPQLYTMDTLDYRNLRNCAIGVIIGTLGFSYFVIYLLMFLIFHFPSSQQSIPYALTVMAFGGGSAIWYLYIPWFGGLFLVWTSSSHDRFSLPSPTIATTWVHRLSHDRGWKPLGRLSQRRGHGGISRRLSLQFASVVLLALVPSIHALAEPLHAPSPLATAFGRLVLLNLCGCALYALRPLERIGMVQFWQPSLHGMYLS
ncbi:unnamed protein product [Penicillium nalgiovense]|nr:unnamed protein product [Penicillium nalgiovense]